MARTTPGSRACEVACKGENPTNMAASEKGIHRTSVRQEDIYIYTTKTTSLMPSRLSLSNTQSSDNRLLTNGPCQSNRDKYERGTNSCIMQGTRIYRYMETSSSIHAYQNTYVNCVCVCVCERERERKKTHHKHLHVSIRDWSRKSATTSDRREEKKSKVPSNKECDRGARQTHALR